jgi:hypothetical protein
VPDAASADPLVVVIDLSRVSALGPRAWQACDQELAAVAQDRAADAVAVRNVAEIAAALTEATAVKPQRSILRAAA